MDSSLFMPPLSVFFVYRNSQVVLNFNRHMLFLDSVCLWFLSRNSFFQEAQVFSFSPVLSVIRTAEVHKEQKQHIITSCRTQLLWAQYKIYRASPFSVFVHSSLRLKQQQHSAVMNSCSLLMILQACKVQ